MSKKLRIAVSGQIGVGKTTLVNKLGSLEGFRAHKEEVDREILEIFTQVNINKTKVSRTNPELLNQFSFLAETIKRDIKVMFDEDTNHVMDRSIIEHIYCFARTNLSYSDYALYHGLQELVLNQLKWEKYDLNILLLDNDESITSKVQKRGRNEEELTEDYKEYLTKLNEIYNSKEFEDVLKEYSKELVVINVNGLNEDQVFNKVKKEIDRRLFDFNFVKEDLLKEFDWLEYDGVINTLEFKYDEVVDLNNLDVNYSDWHDDKLTGNSTFSFNAMDNVYLTVDNYEEFKQVLRYYELKYIKGEQKTEQEFNSDFVKEDLLKEFDWLEYDLKSNILVYNNYTVVNLDDLHVSYYDWHHGVLEGHKTFDFDGWGCVSLRPYNYEEFKQALRDYEKEYIKREQKTEQEFNSEFVKEDLLKEFEQLHLSDEGMTIRYGISKVVGLSGLDVNWQSWHNNKLTGHPTFEFDGMSYIPLTPKNYERFKQILRNNLC